MSENIVLDKDREDKAWSILEEKTDLKLGERMFIRSTYASVYKDDYPFVARKYKKGNVEYYHSEIKEISHYNFLNEKEVILANAIYENVKDDFNPNTFAQQLKFTFRVLGVKSVWAD